MNRPLHRLTMNCPHLTSLTLENINDSYVNILCSALHTNTHLKYLYLKDNNLSDLGMRKIIKATANIQLSFVKDFIVNRGYGNKEYGGAIFHVYNKL